MFCLFQKVAGPVYPPKHHSNSATWIFIIFRAQKKPSFLPITGILGLGNSPRKCYTPGSTNNPLPGKNGPVLIEDVTFYHLVHGDTPAGCDRLPERTNLHLHGIPNFSIRRFESSRSFLRRFGRRSSRDWLRRKAFAWCRLSKGDSDVTLNPCLCESRKSSTSVTARKTHLPH